MRKILNALVFITSLFVLLFGLSSCGNENANNSISNTDNKTNDNGTNNGKTGTDENNVYYTVTWKDYDGTLLQTGNVKEGDIPSYNKSNPTRDNDDNYSYTFSGWSPALSKVNADTVYTATYTKSQIPTYTITFKNYDGTVLQTSSVKEGKMPSFDKSNPTREKDEDYYYAFNGWDKEIVNASENTAYTATYTKSQIPTYTITFKNYDGTILQTLSVKEGEKPSYDKVNPTREKDEDYYYVFNGWNKEIVNANSDATYTATYTKSTIPTYTITFKNYDNSTLETISIKEGDIPSYSGNIPTKSSDDNYRYIFNGWDSEISAATGNKTYTAVFAQADFPYNIAFNLNGGVSASGVSTIRIENLTKDKFKFDITKPNYKFIGWECNGVKVFDENGNIINNIELEEEMTFDAIYEEKILLSIYYTIYNPLDNTFIKKLDNKPDYIENITETMYCDWNKPIDLNVKDSDKYTFVGWYLNGSSLISNSPSHTYMIWEEDINIEARFKYVEARLDIYSNNTDLGQVMIKEGNSQTWYDDQYQNSYFTEEITIAAYSKSNVRFLGWYNENNELVLDKMVYTFNMPNKNYKLEAKWNYFNVTYELPGDDNCSDGGINNSNNPTYYSSDMGNITLLEPARNGFNFVGWEFNGEIVDEINTSNICHMTLIARWKVFDELSYFEFIWGNETVSVIGVTDQSVDRLIIPDYVVTIGNSAFSGCSSLTSIEIPTSVTNIGWSAFSGCSSLHSISLPFVGGSVTSNTYLGYIFGASSSSYNSSYVPSSLKEVIICDGCTSIGEYAFYNCSSLTSITIPNNVTSIGSYAFYNCSSLTSIEIPTSVTSIGKSAFSGCSSLENVYYEGSSFDWSNISIDSNNSELNSANIYYYSETQPVESGNYWHYDESNNPVEW